MITVYIYIYFIILSLDPWFYVIFVFTYFDVFFLTHLYPIPMSSHVQKNVGQAPSLSPGMQPVGALPPNAFTMPMAPGMGAPMLVAWLKFCRWLRNSTSSSWLHYSFFLAKLRQHLFFGSNFAVDFVIWSLCQLYCLWGASSSYRTLAGDPVSCWKLLGTFGGRNEEEQNLPYLQTTGLHSCLAGFNWVVISSSKS